MKHLTITSVGHVDHGKSTLLGRLLFETGAVSDQRLEQARARSAELGRPLEFAFLLDAFEEEQAKNITIDLGRFQFRTAAGVFTVIDAPGHKEFLKNMVSGAASADGVILLVDAEEGMRDQTRRHAYLLRLLGVRQIVVAINKMDRVGYSQQAFESNRAQVESHLAALGLRAASILPVAAAHGVNVTRRSDKLAWHSGPTLLEALEALHPSAPLDRLPARFPVQDIYSGPDGDIAVGRLEAGTLRAGETLRFWPSGTEIPLDLVAPRRGGPQAEARAGESIALRLPRHAGLERGQIGTAPDLPPRMARELCASLFWLGRQPLEKGKAYLLRLATVETAATVRGIERVVRTESLSSETGDLESVAHSEVAEVLLETEHAVPFDRFSEVPTTGRIVLLDGGEVSGGGILTH
jgi:bifunctional enzyme CysN/CysC